MASSWPLPPSRSQEDLMLNLLRTQQQNMPILPRLKQSASPLPCFITFQPAHLHFAPLAAPHLSLPNPAMSNNTTAPSPMPSQRGLPHLPPSASSAMLASPLSARSDGGQAAAPRLTVPRLDAPMDSTSQQSSSFPSPSFCTLGMEGRGNSEEASPSCYKVAQYTCHSGSEEQEDTGGDHDSDDPVRSEAKRIKRLVSNRASAKRSRQRKQDRLAELELVCAKLRVETAETQRKLNEALTQLKQAKHESTALKEKLKTVERGGNEGEEVLSAPPSQTVSGFERNTQQEVGRIVLSSGSKGRGGSSLVKAVLHDNAARSTSPSPLPGTPEHQETEITASLSRVPKRSREDDEGADEGTGCASEGPGQLQEASMEEGTAGAVDEQAAFDMNDVFSGILEETQLVDL